MVAGKGGELRAGQAFVLVPKKDGETESSAAGNLAPLRKALIEDNRRHANLVVCEEVDRSLKRGIGNLWPPLAMTRTVNNRSSRKRLL